MALTSIGDRLTPSVPIEISFEAGNIAVGTKLTTLIGHMAATPGSGIANQTHLMTNIGDPDAAKAEVDAIAGEGSEAGRMAYAFVASNALVGRSTFPAFRVLLLANGETGIPSAALEQLKHLRSDMIVSPYPAGNSAVTQSLVGLAELVSGPDRDLQGQFGSFVTAGSLDAISAVQAYNYNSSKLIIASLPDSNTASVSLTADASSGTVTLNNASSVDGIYPGAKVSGAGIAANSQVLSVSAGKIVLSLPVTAGGTGVDITVQNAVAQGPEIVAAAHAGAMMQSQFPYYPLKGVVVGGLVAPAISSDRVQIDPQGSSEALLIAGVSPMYVAAGGAVSLLKTRTTLKLAADGVSSVSDYNAWQQLVTLNDFREELYLICQNKPFSNAKASLATAQALLGEMVRLALQFEDEGAFQGVKSLVKEFKVEPSKLRRGRFDFSIPVNVLPDLDVIAINLIGSVRYDFSL